MKKKLLTHTKKQKGYPRNKVLLLIVCVILVTVTITSIVYDVISIYGIQNSNYYITVVPNQEVGLSIDTDALYFGKVPQGSTSQRYINITNSHTEPLKVIISFSGKGSRWIAPEDNGFILSPNEAKTITITAHIPEEAKLGDYQGKMNVFFRKV